MLQKAGFECQNCGDKEKTLHVHHKIYRKGASVWDYADTELEVLCEDCHLNETMLRRQLDEAIAQLGAGDLEMLVGFAEAMAAVDHVFNSGDGDELPPNREWLLRSYSHAWGFLARLRAAARPEAIKKFIDFQPIDNSKVFGISAYGLDEAVERHKTL